MPDWIVTYPINDQSHVLAGLGIIKRLQTAKRLSMLERLIDPLTEIRTGTRRLNPQWDVPTERMKAPVVTAPGPMFQRLNSPR
jgi:hypothetical protein